MTTKESLGCDTCTNPAFLDGEKQDVNSVPVYADIIQRTSNGALTNTVDIIYWFFYPYNRGKRVCIGLYIDYLIDKGCAGEYSVFGNHVGDWESVVIRFEDGYITKAYYA